MSRRTLSSAAQDAVEPKAIPEIRKPVTVGSDNPVAAYIADLCASMVEMAESERLDTLAYLIGVAGIEAEMMARKGAKARKS